MKKLVALLLSVMMCFACVSALADTYVSWYTYGDVYLSSVRSEMEADFAKLNLTINGSDANGNQQVQSDFISTALMNNDRLVQPSCLYQQRRSRQPVSEQPRFRVRRHQL